MKVTSILSYLLLIAAGTFTIFGGWRMYHKFRLKYLFTYFLFLIFSYAFYFLDVIGSYFTLGILDFQKASNYTFSSVNLAFSLLALPFISIAWYFFIRMVLEIRKNQFSFKYKTGFILFQTVMLILFAISSQLYIASGASQFLDLSARTIFLYFAINVVILMMVTLQIFLHPLPMDDKNMKKGIRGFAIIYLFITPLPFIFNHFPLPAGLTCYVVPAVEFFMHLLPLLYLWNFLSRYYKEHPLHQVSESDIQKFFSKHQISEREKEIIWLIIQGKSNRTISDDLYISLKTVKAHIYNIYRKLNINSRWQLINLVHNSIKSEP